MYGISAVVPRSCGCSGVVLWCHGAVDAVVLCCVVLYCAVQCSVVMCNETEVKWSGLCSGVVVQYMQWCSPVLCSAVPRSAVQ